MMNLRPFLMFKANSIQKHNLRNQLLLIIAAGLLFIWALDLVSTPNSICAKASDLMGGSAPIKSSTTHPPLYVKTTYFNPGEVILYWSATGDDGRSGRASGYDLRYQPDQNGPIDSDQDWQTAIQASGEPPPSFPGQTDSLVISGLGYGAGYYFCIRAYDNVGNYSVRSNSPLVIAGDTTGNNYVIGDVNDNGLFTGLDIVYLVAYFKGQNPPPPHIMSADANGDCSVTGLDVLYMVEFFKGGPLLIRGDCKNITIGNP